MGRSRASEAGFGSRGKADEGRAREKATRHAVDSTDSLSLDGCLNVEESIKLHEALAQLTYTTNSSFPSFGSSRNGSSENLYKESSSPPGASENLLQGASSPVGGSLSNKMIKTASQTQLAKSNSQPRSDADIASAKNSLSQLLRNSQGKSADANKMLVMVTVLGSVGPLRALVDAEASVQTVIGAALQMYSREGRVPALGLDSSWFDLYSGHVSFSDALEPFQPIKPTNTRNFVMVRRQTQCEEVLRHKEKQRKVSKPTSWLEDVWAFGTWWAKVVVAASPAFLHDTNNMSAKAWLHELDAPPTAISSF